MILRYRPIKKWPEGWHESTRNEAPWSPFKSDWSSTIDLLDRELRHLGADEALLQLDTAEGNCKLDGGLRADAKVTYHGVILSFESKDHGTLTYACNAFDANRDPWRQNVRAIALGLEALRKVERYGIANRGEQYAGYAELPSGIAMGAAKMTVEQAAEFLCIQAGWDRVRVVDLISQPDMRESAFRQASKRLHPDVGGDPEFFRTIVEARELLEAAA